MNSGQLADGLEGLVRAIYEVAKALTLIACAITISRSVESDSDIVQRAREKLYNAL